MASVDSPVVPAAARPDKTIEIFVNARPFEVAAKEVSFEQVVALAFPGQAPGTEMEYIVTYTRAKHGNGSGSLAPGGTVTVKKGTSFSAHTTTRS